MSYLRLTQSIMYVPLQVNRFKKIILLIVQYQYLKSCSRRFYFPESDSPHKIILYDVYYSTQLSCWFSPDRICQLEMISIGGVPVLKRHFGWAGPYIFYKIHRGERPRRCSRRRKGLVVPERDLQKMDGRKIASGYGLAIEKIGDSKKLEILVQIQSFWNIVGARPTASTSQQRER